MFRIEQRNTKIFKGEYKECARCGFGYVKSTLVNQNGLLVCTNRSIPKTHGTVVGCLDQPSYKETEVNKS